MQTFDLHAARHAREDYPCPHHGMDACDCQMVVLLIYEKADEPVTLILYGNDGQTWLSFVNNPLQRANPSIRSSIERALQLDPSE
jgi:hypothetical protein